MFADLWSLFWHGNIEILQQSLALLSLTLCVFSLAVDLESLFFCSVVHANMPRYNEVYGAVLERPYASLWAVAVAIYLADLGRILCWHGDVDFPHFTYFTFCWADGLLMSSSVFQEISMTCTPLQERYHRLQREIRHLGEVADLEDLKTQASITNDHDGFMTVWTSLDMFGGFSDTSYVIVCPILMIESQPTLVITGAQSLACGWEVFGSLWCWGLDSLGQI